MKKIIALISIICLILCAFVACKSDEVEVTNPATEPTETAAGAITPVDKDNIDWETPIDIDDSFVEDATTPAETAPVTTEPIETDASGETKPQTTNPTEPSSDPTDPTDSSDVTEAPTSAPTEAPDPTESTPPKTSSSGAIELPMIPG